MTVVVEQVLVLFIFALAGYILSKVKLINVEHSRLLSCIEVYIFLPSLVFNTFSKNFTVNYIREKYIFLIVSFVVLLFVISFAFIVSRFFSKDKYIQKVYCYSFVVPNFGYMGYALAESIFGTGFLLNMMIYGLPISIFTYTAGFTMLTGGKISLKKLLNPVIIAIILGCFVGITNIHIPNTITTMLSKSSACMAPVSMILTGIAVSEFKLKELLCEKKSYIVSFMRLLVIPFTISGILSILINKEIALIALLIYCMPCGLNTIVFPKLVGKDCKTGASFALISNVLACITIPICIYVFS